ncbi:MAG: S41 family peptidase [bacterium]
MLKDTSPIPIPTAPRHRLHRRLLGGGLLFGLVLISLIAGIYIGLVVLKARGYTSSGIPAYILNGKNPDKSKQADLGLFWQAWNAIDSTYYGTANDNKRVEGAISGMVAGLGDPYTVYFPPSQNTLFQSDLQGNFGGIGAQLDVKDGLLTIESALDGTPAQKAGLKGGDIIVQIGDKKVAAMSFDDAINAIRGEKGSTVKLTIARAGAEKPLLVSLVRDTITVKSVTSSTLGDKKQFAYIKVNQFGSDTNGLLDAALHDAASKNEKGLVIDLRDNPGGYLDSAVEAIGRVIPRHPTETDSRLQERTAVVEKFKDGSQDVHTASDDPILDTIPMVVLVNGGSASASEIFAGAMRDYHRATLVGTKTFGKGSAQEVVPLSNKGSVKITVAKWFTPLGVTIDGKGLSPDVTVALPDGTPTSTTDAQVSKALEILTK